MKGTVIESHLESALEEKNPVVRRAVVKNFV